MCIFNFSNTKLHNVYVKLILWIVMQLMEAIRETLTLVCMLLNLVPSDYTIQITMVYIKLDECNQLQIVYIDMELERESLCLVNELAFFHEYICSFDNQVRNQIVHAIYIKTFCCCCAFYVTHHLP